MALLEATKITLDNR
jgi:uncharacterized coiled-coil protein SlyX